MDTHCEPMLSAEVASSEERFSKAQARIIRDMGYGDTKGALAISQEVAGRLSEALAAALAVTDTNLSRVLRRLEPDVLALCALSTCFHSIATDDPLRTALTDLGHNLNQELWARGLIEHDRRLAARVERTVRKKHGSLKYRRQSARSISKRAGYDTRAPWGRVERLKAGEWLINVVLEALPDVFVLATEQDGTMRLTITDGALAIAERACAWAIRRAPVFLPSTITPLPWTAWSKGGPTDPRMQHSATVVRSHHRQTAGLVNAAIKSGQMKPALDALNTIQATAWTMNVGVLDALRKCHERQDAIKGLPRVTDYPMPAKDKPWEDMADLERTFWKIKASGIAKANRGLVSERVSFAEDMATAEELQSERFYTPCNLDWRGRVYPLPHFNFQREDRVRALFLFADGEPIGEEGLYWLKVHTANCGDFGKMSKAPFEERVQWVDSNISAVIASAEDPMHKGAIWALADKPFLFLAAAQELAQAMHYGPGFITRLPVSWDGSCSGLQHLCAMTRAKEGEFVNLTPGLVPQDVYQKVADATALDVAVDANECHEIAHLCLDHGINRKLVKRNVMTYSYSSKKFGMSKQLEKDVMEPLALEVMDGKRDEHPYGDDDGKAAARYLAHRIYNVIEQVVEKPAQAMAFLQRLARTLAHEGKALSWVTPVGIPWVNRYYEFDVKRVTLWLHDNGVKLQHKTALAVGHHKEIDKTRAANGVAPNFVHACDASHLMLVVNAAYAEGVRQFALVHDSFGCLASQSVKLHRIIREQFVAMYEQHDVLAEIMEQAKLDLTQDNHKRLPEAVEVGPLNIKEVVNARYAFA